MRRILVVDDDLHVGQAISVWLAALGFRVATADGGVTGLVALDNATFDLMIVDVFMPRGHGIERLRSARMAHPGVPIIAISGQFDPGIGAAGAAAAALHVDRVVAKPFEREAMLDAVRSLIGRPS